MSKELTNLNLLKSLDFLEAGKDLDPTDPNFFNLIFQEDVVLKAYSKLSTPEEREIFEAILQEFANEGYSPTFGSLIDKDYALQPPTMYEFIMDEYYLGKQLNPEVMRRLSNDPEFDAGLYDYWVTELMKITDPNKHFTEVIIQASIGSGKTTAASILMLYDLACMLCLRSPNRYYGLIENTSIAFALFNIREEQAIGVTFDKVLSLFNDSPFFQERTLPSRSKSAIRLADHEGKPSTIEVIAGSRFVHGLGRDIFGFMIDEANFGDNDEVDKRTGTKINQVAENLRSLSTRMESRFRQKGGKVAGRGIIVSSKTTKNSFLAKHVERKMIQAENSKKDGLEPDTYFIDAPRWVIQDLRGGKKTGKYSGKMFDVFVGIEGIDSYIIKPGATPNLELGKVIQVPIEEYNNADHNLETFLCDIANESISSKARFFTSSEQIRKCFTDSFPKFWEADTIKLPYNQNFSIGESGKFNLAKFQTYLAKSSFYPRSIHLDLATRGDRIGMACSYYTTDAEGKKKYIVDFSIAFESSNGEEMPLEAIEKFIRWLAEKGLKIGMISFDTFQSSQMRQSLELSGFKVKTLSVDKTDIPYTELRTMVRHEQVSGYNNNLLFQELINLEYNMKDRKVDHPINGSKDIADGTCGSLYNLVNDAATFYVPGGSPVDEFRLLQSIMGDGDDEDIQSFVKGLNNYF